MTDSQDDLPTLPETCPYCGAKSNRIDGHYSKGRTYRKYNCGIYLMSDGEEWMEEENEEAIGFYHMRLLQNRLKDNTHNTTQK